MNMLACIRELEAALGRPWIDDDYNRTMNRVSKVYNDVDGAALDDEIRQELVHLLGDNRSNNSDVVRDILFKYYGLLLRAMASVEEAFVVQPLPGILIPEDLEEEEEEEEDDEMRFEEETILSHLKTRDGDDDDIHIDELEAEICCICLEDLHQKEKKKIAKLQCCNHEFHACCIVEWLRRGTNICPLCKALAICR